MGRRAKTSRWMKAGATNSQATGRFRFFALTIESESMVARLHFNGRTWALDEGLAFWTVDCGLWIALDCGLWILDFGFWILDFGFLGVGRLYPHAGGMNALVAPVNGYR